MILSSFGDQSVVFASAVSSEDVHFGDLGTQAQALARSLAIEELQDINTRPSTFIPYIQINEFVHTLSFLIAFLLFWSRS